jgi:predicted transposase YdaD
LDAIEKRSERKGKREGIREGEREGERKGRLEAAMAMLDDGLPIETASKYSGIPADELSLRAEERKRQ